MLRKALNIKLQEHVTNKEVYGKLPLVSSKIKARRMNMTVGNGRERYIFIEGHLIYTSSGLLLKIY